MLWARWYWYEVARAKLDGIALKDVQVLFRMQPKSHGGRHFGSRLVIDHNHYLYVSVMWSELLMTSAISCPRWSSVYECQGVDCAFTSPVRTECGMFVMYCMQCCMSVSAVL